MLSAPQLAPALAVSKRMDDADVSLAVLDDSAEQEALTETAKAHIRAQRHEEAAAVLRRLCELRPADTGMRLRLATALIRSQRLPEAQTELHKVIEADRDCAEAYRLLGIAYLDAGFHSFAIDNLKFAAKLNPNSAGVSDYLRTAYMATGDWRASLALSEAASGRYDKASLISLLHSPDATAEVTRAAHCAWAGAQPLPSVRPIARRSTRSRRIRVGYHSGEMAYSPAFHFVAPLLRERDHERFEVFSYSTGLGSDVRTDWYRANSDHFRGDANDASWEQQIAADELDILVDLSGHYGSGRLDLFRKRLAPIQVAFPSYPATTGMPEMDYIFTDRWVCPAGSESQYCEKPWKLASGYLPYAPPCEPPVTEEPSGLGGPLTFGLFQRPSKMNAEVWDSVAAVLREVPDSRLLIHFQSEELETPECPLREILFGELERRGIGRARVSLRGAAPHPEHMNLLASTSIALDTFPYNGQTTACECLWMGIPVVSVLGQTHVSRVGWQILDRIGLGEYCAESPSECVETAVALARDKRRLSMLRSGLRERMKASPMLDGSVIKEIEQSYLSLTT